MARVEIRLKRRKRHRRRLLSGGIALIAFASTLFWAVPYVRHTSTVETAAAHRQTLALADGSQAELNAHTSLHTDFRFGRRIVRLDRGEAFFSVAKDAAHPFLVETPAGTVHVTGTQFNIRLPYATRAEVTLLEGSVMMEGVREKEEGRGQNEAGHPRVSGVRSSVALTPGQQFDTALPTVRMLTTAELENTIAWRSGRLALNGLTLGEAAARLAAYHGIRIEVAPDVAGLRLGGTYPVEDLDGVLRAFENALTVKVLPRGVGSYSIITRK